jgi:lipoprotein-anchoring transpeptidase ErfK/SrfK
MFSCPYLYFDEYSNFYRATYSITINVRNHSLTLFKDNKVFKTYPVAVGKGSTPTPNGVFRIINKQVNPGGPYGARWMGLSVKGVGIHGTDTPDLIGKPVSHGCIRMYNKDVVELFNLVSVGTVVKII